MLYYTNANWQLQYQLLKPILQIMQISGARKTRGAHIYIYIIFNVYVYYIYVHMYVFLEPQTTMVLSWMFGDFQPFPMYRREWYEIQVQ